LQIASRGACGRNDEIGMTNGETNPKRE